MTEKHVLSANVDLLSGIAVSGFAKIEAVGLGLDGISTVVIPAVRDVADNVIFTGPQKIKLNAGQLLDSFGDPIQLPDSDGGVGMSPAEWSYRVTLQLDHLQASQYPVYVFTLNEDLDLADVVSVPASTGAADSPWNDAAARAETAAGVAEAYEIDALDAATAAIAARDEVLASGTLFPDEAGVYAPRYGVVADDGTDDAAAFTSAQSRAVSTKNKLILPGGIVKLSSLRTVTDARTWIEGKPGTIVQFDHGNVGLRADPLSTTAIGPLSAGVSTGTTVIPFAAGSFVASEHVGRKLLIVDTNPFTVGNDNPSHVRKIIANTTSTITVDVGVGKPIASGMQASVIVPADELVIRNVIFQRTGGGTGANMVLSHYRSIVLDNVSSLDAGAVGGSQGNAISVYHSDKVRGYGINVERAEKFGLFTYHCDDAIYYAPRVDVWQDQFAIQLKDCTRSGVVEPKVRGGNVQGVGSTGEAAINLKCSGLNPAYGLFVHGGKLGGSSGADVQFSSIQNEGDAFVGEDFEAVGVESRGSGGAGFATIVGPTTVDAITGWRWARCVAADAWQIGFVPIRGMTLDRVTAKRCGYEGIAIGGYQDPAGGGLFYPSSNVTLDRPLLQDNAQRYVSGVTRSSEILVDSFVTDTLIIQARSRRTTIAKSIQLVRETPTNPPARTEIVGWKNVDKVGAPALTRDFSLVGSGSSAKDVRGVFNGTPTVNAWADVDVAKAVDTALAAGTTALTADTETAFAALLAPGTYDVSGVIGWNGSTTTGDFKFGIGGGTATYTGTFQLLGPAINATATPNVAATTWTRVAVGSTQPLGGIGSDVWSPISGRIVVTAGGTVIPQFAQNATDAAAVVKLLIGSRIRYTRRA